MAALLIEMLKQAEWVVGIYNDAVEWLRFLAEGGAKKEDDGVLGLWGAAGRGGSATGRRICRD
jgi:hypothetical protein